VIDLVGIWRGMCCARFEILTVVLMNFTRFGGMTRR